jgi:hypothetical protein
MKLLSLFLLAACAFGQSVVVKALNGVSSGTSSSILNQGQTAHNLYAQYTGAGCTSAVGAIQIEASYDGVVYFGITAAPIGLALSGSVYQGTVAVSAGPYPFLRVNQYAATANCTVVAWYSGGRYAISQPQMMQASESQWRYANLAGSATDDFLINGPGTVSKRITVYALAVSNLSAANSVNVILSGDTLAIACASTSGIQETFFNMTLAPQQTVVVPASSTPIATVTDKTYYVCAHITGTSPNYSISAVYRMEQ